MSRIRKWDIGLLILTILIVALTHITGCTTTQTGWHPQSEREMRQVVGETVLMAMDQYQAYLRAIAEHDIQGSLKGQSDADKPTH